MKKPSTEKPKVTWTPVKAKATHAFMGLTDDDKLVRSEEVSVYMWMN